MMQPAQKTHLVSAYPRVAILGMHLEANRFAPPTERQDFQDLCWEAGAAIDGLARKISHLPSELPGFYERMDATGPWTAVPILCVAAQPGGPMQHAVFEEVLSYVTTTLTQALPVDAVYVSNHGASSSTECEDTDGVLLQAIRDIVGVDVPIIVTLDLHCNVSYEMASACDAIISYLTNPHVDQRDRGAEAASMIREIGDGIRPTMSFIRIPIAAPTITLLTAQGPYADLVNSGQSFVNADVCNVSVMGGFVLSDLKKCGLTIAVTTRNNIDLANRITRKIAELAWADRERYSRQLTSLDQAISAARDANSGSRRPVILADVADNPGGGGRGNTVTLMEALHHAQVCNSLVGLFVDPALVNDAETAGVGVTINAVFNRVEQGFSKRFEARAKVVELTNGSDIGRRGQYARRHFKLGNTALLRLEGSGLLVVVVSLRRALNEPVMVEMHGVDLSTLDCLVVKSRGHFRAGFDEFFKDDQILEVDVPGLTSPVLSNFEFASLPRPIYPLDQETEWSFTPSSDQLDYAAS